MTLKPPALSAIASAALRSSEGAELVASALWQNSTCAVLILRRPGCVLCRDEAQRLWALKPEFDKLGVSLVCVVHEWIQREINAFTPAYWPGPLYHDTSKSFYAALNNGTPLRGSLLPMLNPWSDVWKRIRAASKTVKEHNLAGEGAIMGGAMVIRQGEGGVAWCHVESTIGLVADPAEVLAAAAKEVRAHGNGKAAAAAAAAASGEAAAAQAAASG
ncbi:Redox-regulatory protein [Tetrabaena socialis]|uniref:Peroxiredoxin-like 2A n=1 Tax=Tetrabaena socialis TaxID=47790 RepID=A0A2J8A6G3_9CHLO|nr:Redox-regulatory protein [Tetrabaena socialis]|eukprot:PNH08122.1 Redox-regulatory protein [Tetrabaena socialis]